MVKQLVPDELWMIIDPLMPPAPPKLKGGRLRVPDREALRNEVRSERFEPARQLSYLMGNTSGRGIVVVPMTVLV